MVFCVAPVAISLTCCATLQATTEQANRYAGVLSPTSSRHSLVVAVDTQVFVSAFRPRVLKYPLKGSEMIQPV